MLDNNLMFGGALSYPQEAKLNAELEISLILNKKGRAGRLYK